MAFLNAPVYLEDLKDWLRKMSVVVNNTMQGKTNNTGTVTLTANSATTTLTEAPNRIGQGTVVLFMPTTANAAAEATTLHATRNVASNTFTLTHTNNAQTDRIFNYILVG